MKITWFENTTGAWVNRQVNNTVASGTYRWHYTQASVSGTKYWWHVHVYDDTTNISIICHFTTNVSGYSSTIRTNGLDYFVWVGVNTTACYVKNNLTGMGEATEYVAIYSNTGTWSKFYGNNIGTNWTVHTFDVIRTYMDDAPGSITFSIVTNTFINFNASRNVNLIKKGNGYNYTGYTFTDNTTLSAINTTLGLASGYSVALWNRTLFEWVVWISGYGTSGGGDYTVTRWDVINTKIESDKTWVI
jgi:hypothetical protein